MEAGAGRAKMSRGRDYIDGVPVEILERLLRRKVIAELKIKRR